ncbi:signal peptidase II [Ruminococcaceae bacterium CPB6]|jgi:signal peptidase II|uniref:Lipoprotein signal peptidase n=1 Tax=Caproicibacterium lactatifermentans TaxID=2666138 RepID=A0A859DPT6_9FIRM|nr:signal peptidase II [Caproicibacterium lactatifermentans]ARP50180.1 signal peptidase II [Ruminococcaceae bacterium CPB6]QKN24097.1 signal peptidase II [Caproicibacterium lactatifermentans]
MPFIALLLAAAAVAVDQILKLLVVRNLMPVGIITLIPHFLSLQYLENRGAAFGILQNRQWAIALITGIICVFIVVAMFRYQERTKLFMTVCTLILGGGVGNILDRLLRGYVVDYIHFHFFPFIFNFADICVVVGVALLIISLFLPSHEPKTEENHA